MRWPFISRREQLRREAAHWIARLNGPGADAERQAFERWYASSPDRASAYDRLAQIFQAAGGAGRPQVAPQKLPDRAGNRRFRPLGYAFAAAAAAVALLAFIILSARTVSPLPDAQQQVATFSAQGESRRIVLADGSEVLLSADSALEVALSADERRLRLQRGEARFSVAHEARPFIVAAEGTQVIARGTQFIVHVAHGRTVVALVEGSVDVAYRADRAGERRQTRLKPGERLVVDTGRISGSSAAQQARASVQTPPAVATAMLVFDETPLGEAIERANQGAGPLIRIADPSLASLRISGAFRRGDTAGLAASIAAAFDLEVERRRDGSLWLRPRRQTANPAD